MPVTTRIITCLGPGIPNLTLICFDCILGGGHTQCIHGIWVESLNQSLSQKFHVIFKESQSFKARCPSCCHLKLAGDCMTYMDIRESCRNIRSWLMLYHVSFSSGGMWICSNTRHVWNHHLLLLSNQIQSIKHIYIYVHIKIIMYNNVKMQEGAY